MRKETKNSTQRKINTSLKFIEATDKLIAAGSWEETLHQIAHRFGKVRFLSYSRPKSDKEFYLDGRKWKATWTRNLKEGQYAKEIYSSQDGWLHHVEIPLTSYRPYGVGPLDWPESENEDKVPF